MAFALPRSVSKPLLDPRDSLSLFAADYAIRTAVATSETVEPTTWRTALKSVAEVVRVLPVIEKPGDKGHGIYVERTLLDAFLPLNATISVVRAMISDTSCPFIFPNLAHARARAEVRPRALAILTPLLLPAHLLPVSGPGLRDGVRQRADPFQQD